MEKENLLLQLKEKIVYGEDLIGKLQCIRETDGAKKLIRKIRQETEFLKKLDRRKAVKVEQLCCSNLRHLGAMVDCALRPGVVAVCKIFHINEDSKLVIDIISEEGKIWTKVIARNPKSLSALSSGNASYGARSILDQAKDYMKCANLYPCMYKPPQVIFEFVSGIEESLAKKLKLIGVKLKGDIIPDSGQFVDCDDDDEADDEDEDWNSENSETGQIDNICQSLSDCLRDNPEINVLNLDVTAMMAFVSNMTNGRCNFVFKQEVLTQQSSWESERPVKPILENLFEGKKLVCCDTAWNDFEKIVNTLGGTNERNRTLQLKDRVTILPDDFGGDNDYPRRNLKVRGNVRVRSKIIFNFGHRIKALTVSANEGFVRAAKQQGVTYAAFIHESRALTEGKESSASQIL